MQGQLYRFKDLVTMKPYSPGDEDGWMPFIGGCMAIPDDESDRERMAAKEMCDQECRKSHLVCKSEWQETPTGRGAWVQVCAILKTPGGLEPIPKGALILSSLVRGSRAQTSERLFHQQWEPVLGVNTTPSAN